MNIRFNMELEDHLAFYRNYFENSKIYKKQKYKNYFILPIIFTLGILYHFISHNVVIIEIVLFYTLISLSRGIFWYFFFDKLTLRKMRNNLESWNNNILFGPIDMILNDENIITEKKWASNIMPWNLIIKYVFDDKYIYLYISEDRCVIIPLYKLEEQKKDRIEFIKNKKPA